MDREGEVEDAWRGKMVSLDNLILQSLKNHEVPMGVASLVGESGLGAGRGLWWGLSQGSGS